MPRMHPVGLNRCPPIFWMLCGLAAPACGAAGDAAFHPTDASADAVAPDAQAGRQDFDIPAQALENALIEYGNVSGHPALFPSDIVVGRVSAALHGRYTAETALNALLRGTGIVAQRHDSSLGATYVLRPVEAAGAAVAARPAQGLARLYGEREYPGLVQASVWQALCAHGRTEPGGYRALFRFQVDASGQVNGARLLRSTGDAGRDRLVLAVLDGVRIDRPTPPALVQHPLTMLLRRDDARAGLACGPAQGH